MNKTLLVLMILLITKANAIVNGTMFQYFEWYSTAEDNTWLKLKNEAKTLSDLGITAVWIPPAYKGAFGKKDAGYAVYDKYDLGEFDQRGSIATKYGTKLELTNAVNELHNQQIQVYGDIVLNHLMGDIDKYDLVGADESEEIEIIPVSEVDRNQYNPKSLQKVKAWTKFTFPNRGGQYSDFIYDSRVMNGISWELIIPKQSKNNIYLMNNHVWSKLVDNEYGNFDYLLGLNLDYSNPEMKSEAKKWGGWFTKTLQLDGYRLDAVKHIDSDFMRWWLKSMRNLNPNAFAVGEYWHGDLAKLEDYENKVDWSMSLFDVPLHFNFYNASKNASSYDLRHILDNTMVSKHPLHAVTFVDNHDTEVGQSLESFIDKWFKPIAYALILTRQDGYPCVFYGDYYGIPSKNILPVQDQLQSMLQVRKNNAFGLQKDYFNSAQTIGWIREGNTPLQGLAAIANSNDSPKYLDMNVGIKHRNQKWIDATKNYNQEVYIDNNGNGKFLVAGKSVSIWIPAKNN